MQFIGKVKDKREAVKHITLLLDLTVEWDFLFCYKHLKQSKFLYAFWYE